MVFNTGAALLDAVVLAVVSRESEGTYGYKITQDVREVLDVSESTLYPVLRRLKKDGCLEVYDKQYGGGFLMIAGGILLLWLVVWICAKCFPWIITKIREVCNNILGRGRE